MRCGFKTLTQVIAEQGGDLDDVMLTRQSELAMLDEFNIITDTDPSEVTEGGAVQAARPMGTEAPFEETKAVIEEEEDYPEEEGTEDLSEQLQGD